jgi:hypothetical protein
MWPRIYDCALQQGLQSGAEQHSMVLEMESQNWLSRRGGQVEHLITANKSNNKTTIGEKSFGKDADCVAEPGACWRRHKELLTSIAARCF